MSIWALTQFREIGQTRTKKIDLGKQMVSAFNSVPTMFPINPVLPELFMLLVLLFLCYRMELSMMEAGKSSVRSSQGWGVSKLDSVVRNLAGRHSPACEFSSVFSHYVHHGLDIKGMQWIHSVWALLSQDLIMRNW